MKLREKFPVETPARGASRTWWDFREALLYLALPRRLESCVQFEILQETHFTQGSRLLKYPSSEPSGVTFVFNQWEFSCIGFAAQPGSEKRVRTAWRWQWQDSNFHGFQKTGTFSGALSSSGSSQGLPRGLERRRPQRKARAFPTHRA